METIKKDKKNIKQQFGLINITYPGLTQEDFVQYFMITLPKRMNGELPKPLAEMEDQVGSLDRVTNLTRVVQ